jgi:hypothetical protein
MAGPVSACRIRPASLGTPGSVLPTDSGSHPLFRAPCYPSDSNVHKADFSRNPLTGKRDRDVTRPADWLDVRESRGQESGSFARIT